jgi:hypothetical protein
MITGSTAAGEPIPPHFQFSTMAQSEDTQRVNIRMSAFFPKIKGTFGTNCEKEWPVTLGMNLKGGMDEREFRSYFLNSIVPLFPDAQDVRGKRVIMKVDSGPGRMELGFLAEARTLGFIIYPGVPNTTAVTQETDQSYGTFKTQFVKNLKILSDARLIGNYNIGLPPWMVGLVVFGGTDPISGVVVPCSAFNVAFSKERNCAVWEKCGAAPLTRACLQNNSQVRREMGDGEDATNTAMVHIQESNNVSTHFLLCNGYNGNAFKETIKKVSRKSVTVRHSAERIEKIQKATTHGNLFHATGGGHLTDDDIFLAAQKKVVETEIKELQKRKESAGKMLDIERKARLILVQTKSFQTYNIAELRVLLTYYQVKGLSGMKKDAMAEKWKEILQSQKDAPICIKWSANDEANLSQLTSRPITLADTALGRHQQVIKRQVSNVVTKMSREERDDLRKKLEKMDEMEEEDHSPLISVFPKLDCEKSPSKPEGSTEKNNIEGINESMI